MIPFASVTELLASFIVPAITAVLVVIAGDIILGWIQEVLS